MKHDKKVNVCVREREREKRRRIRKSGKNNVDRLKMLENTQQERKQ